MMWLDGATLWRWASNVAVWLLLDVAVAALAVWAVVAIAADIAGWLR